MNKKMNEKQKVVFFGEKNKQTVKILSLFGIYSFTSEEEPGSFFEFKNLFLKEKTQFIFLKQNKKFRKELEAYFVSNYENLKKVRTSVSFLRFDVKRLRWHLEAIKL